MDFKGFMKGPTIMYFVWQIVPHTSVVLGGTMGSAIQYYSRLPIPQSSSFLNFENINYLT